MVSALMETLTMRPQPAANIGGTAARAIRNGPTTLVSITIRQVSGAVSQKRVGAVMKCSLTFFIPRPALFTRTSRWPNRSSAVATIRLQSSSLVTSPTNGRTRPPAGRASKATRSTSSRSRAAAAVTVAPARASPWVIARRRPRPPPVTMTTRPSSESSTFICGPLYSERAMIFESHDSRVRGAAIDRDRLARYKGRAFGGKEEHGADQISRFFGSRHALHADENLLLRRRNGLARDFSENRTRKNGVDRDAVGTQL